ncbi:sensor histidine kinase [Lacrimispora amygdalina]|uniref:histidine kinase n=1 Tax=Lacrimispora amygdalina TaxID=253257 RepID=A0A3E2NDH7_9FIRM|nr:HAMP domain-containing sensor histidine kinase [Clostridium indicum]RFZ78940.1 sensor histidine kinase [Clostridium indicum]
MKTLKKQLSMTILLTLLITIALIGLASNLLINWEFEKYITKTGQERRDNIADELGSQYDEFKRSWRVDYVHAIGMNSLYDGYIVKLYDADGNMVWDAENHDMRLCGQIMDEISARMKERGAKGGFVDHTYELTQNGKKTGSVSIKYYGPFFMNETDFNFIRVMNIVLLVIGVLSGICAIVVGCLLGSRISRPVTKTAYIAKQISTGNYDLKFEPGTRIKELDDLGIAINHLSDDLSEQENLRKRLTADVAHELRTPLTALGTHLEAMTEGLWEATPERLKSCHEEVKRLGTLVADLEQLAKIEGDGFRINKGPMDLFSAVQTAAENMTGEINKKKLVLGIKGEPVFVEGDKNRMGQVFSNLLSNAVKYTPEGGSIRIEVYQTKENGIVTIADTGIGIKEEELPLIFQRFYRTDRSRNRKTGGAGIGLTIVKSIVEAHGGTVEAESKEESGSCFTVSIPKSDL